MSVRDPIDRNRPFTGSMLNEALRNAGPEIVGGVGAAVQSNKRQAVVSPRGRKPHRFVQWIGRVVSSEQDGDNWRWFYTICELVKPTPGYGGWMERTNGREIQGYAWAEDNNGPDGILGAGYDTANLPGTFEPKPIPDGSIVIVTEVTLTDETQTKEGWIERVIGPDGECKQGLSLGTPSGAVA